MVQIASYVCFCCKCFSWPKYLKVHSLFNFILKISVYLAYYYSLFFIEIPTFLLILNILKFFGFGPMIILKSLLNIKVVTVWQTRDYIQIFIAVLLHHKAKWEWSRIIDIVLIVQKLICKRYYNLNIKNFLVLIIIAIIHIIYTRIPLQLETKCNVSMC